MDKKIKGDILDNSKGMVLDALFSEFQLHFGSVYEHSEIKEMFLSFLVELINDGELKLARNGEFLSGSPEEQVDIIRRAWPTEYDKNTPEKDIEHLCWITDCPAGAVWFYPDGYEEWT